MENIKSIDFNKTYIIEDIFSTGLMEISKIKKLIHPKNKNINENEKLNCFFASTLEIVNKNTNINIFPFECNKICELILYLKTIYKERTKDNIFPFCFYIRKINDKIIFFALDKKIRQLLFGIYSRFYNNIPIIKGYLYGFECKINDIKVYKTGIPSKEFLELLKNIDENINISLNYNCMVCKKKVTELKECINCKWALYCSNKCFNDKIFKKHISDKLLEEKLNYFDELKIS